MDNYELGLPPQCQLRPRAPSMKRWATSTAVASETRIVPESAAASRRAAVFTVSPVTAYAAPAAPPKWPATTGPVWSAHVERDGLAQTPLPILAERGGAYEHVQRGVAGAGGIVLVGEGSTEDREHGVPDELLDETLVALDRPCERLEQRVLEGTDRLRIEPLREGGEPGEVREEHGHLAAIGLLFGSIRHVRARDGLRLGRGRWARPRKGDERAAASRAEREVRLTGRATAGAQARQPASTAWTEGEVRGALDTAARAGHHPSSYYRGPARLARVTGCARALTG